MGFAAAAGAALKQPGRFSKKLLDLASWAAGAAAAATGLAGSGADTSPPKMLWDIFPPGGA